MTLSEKLQSALESGIRQIGQIIIHPKDGTYLLHHIDDSNSDHSTLTVYSSPTDARAIGLYGPDGEFRFTKGQLDLKNGWLLTLPDLENLRRALDIFYPASLGLWFAHKDGTIRVQNLRPKLSRQTGMYRFASTISDHGAQDLVQSLCGPGNNCVKKILWKLDDTTPLVDSDASRFNGIPSTADDTTAIPLVCQEACNFFVAQCRKRAKQEFENAQA